MQVHFSISGEKIFTILGIRITNTLFLSFVISFSLAVLLFFVFRKAKEIPNKFQNFFEWLFESFLNFITGITGSQETTKTIFPLFITLFLFILCSNLIELFPGVGVFKFLRSPSSDLNITLGLGIFSVLYVNFLVLKELGFFKYIKRFLNKNPLFLFVGILEFFSEITRILSLSFRLYGNLLAGEILLVISYFLFGFLLPIPFLSLEILVGFIQAFIFSFLIVIFYITSIQEHEK